MYIVYILQSKKESARLYKGFTTNLKDRLERHNLGNVYHTAKYKPWKLIFYACFQTKKKALDFENYLKTGSGTAFMRKRLIETNKNLYL